MSRKVVITGTGVVSCLGDSRESLQQALCSGRQGTKPVEMFETPEIEHPWAGEIASFQAGDYLGSRGLRPLNRTARLLTVAAHLAIQDSGWEPEQLSAADVGLIAGTMFCSAHTISDFDIRALQEGPSRASPLDFANTVINAAAGQAALWHGLTGINSTISSGGAAGAEALAYACELIRNGVSRALLAGGVEELGYETMFGFDNSGLLCTSPGRDSPRPIPFDARRNGICLAEGAALLMLEESESAMARGATILGSIDGFGSAFDCQPRHRTEPDIESAVAATERAAISALDDARLGPSDMNAISCSANGDPWLDRVEARGLARVFQGLAKTLPSTAIKSMLGDSLGAASATQAVAMVAALRDGRLPGIARLEESELLSPLCASSQTQDLSMQHALLSAVGMDGHCCSLVMAR